MSRTKRATPSLLPVEGVRIDGVALIIYCTFSFVADEEGNAIDPYTFNWEERSEEGTFSYLFYEAYCDELVSEYATLRQSNAIEKFKDAAVVYEDVYADLSGLDVED